MKLISREWSSSLGGYTNMWLADDETGITADFDPDGNEGSMIYVISTDSVYMKNTKRKWQKCGTSEVIE